MSSSRSSAAKRGSGIPGISGPLTRYAEPLHDRRRREHRVRPDSGGDHIYKMNYYRMVKQHVDTRADVTTGNRVPIEEGCRYGIPEHRQLRPRPELRRETCKSPAPL